MQCIKSVVIIIFFSRNKIFSEPLFRKAPLDGCFCFCSKDFVQPCFKKRLFSYKVTSPLFFILSFISKYVLLTRCKMFVNSEKRNKDANIFLIMRKQVTFLVPIFQYIIFASECKPLRSRNLC